MENIWEVGKIKNTDILIMMDKYLIFKLCNDYLHMIKKMKKHKN